MKKSLAFGLALAGALSIAGCESVDNFLQSDVIDPAASLFQNPNTQLVINDVEITAQAVAQDTQALACVIAAGSAVAGQIESNPAFNSSASLQGTNLKIQVVSSAVCDTLDGVLAGNVTVAAGGTVLQQ
jgi:hypothetical protein